MAEQAPTTEIGRVVPGGVAPWRSFYIDPNEYVPELQWPLSVQVYDRMGDGDAKLKGLLRSVELALSSRRWAIEPNGADEASYTALAEDLDLPIVGEDEGARVRRRMRNRFGFKQHLRVLLKALQYGHYYFEQVMDIVEDGPGFRYVIKKLAPRPPRTISEIRVADDGGLESIVQTLSGTAAQMAEPIPVERLIAYVWELEAGNWTGRSMLRSCYRNWLVKDRLIRVDAIGHERGAVGVPVAEAPQGAGREELVELSRMMQEMRMTERGGGAVPFGTKVQIAGGNSVNAVIDSIRFHNEEMGAAFMAEVLNLGQGQAGGSYALGKVQDDHYGQSIDAIQEWVLDIFNPFMIEDWYDWNYGDQSQPARLVVEEEKVDPAPAALQQGLNDAQTAAENELAQVADQAQAKAAREKRSRGHRKAGRAKKAEAVSVESPSPPLPDRALRRQPYAHEAQAAVDFAKIDQTLDAGVSKLAEELKLLQSRQVDELRDAVVAANGDLRKLSVLSPTPVGKDAILSAMNDAAAMGADEAASEALRQGVQTPHKAEVADMIKRLEARAEAVDNLLANAMGQAAQRQAMRLSGGSLSATDVADAVASHLRGLSTAYLETQANGVLTAAMNAGRATTMRRNNPSRVYASELLDANTCENCVAVDGTEFAGMDEAEQDYPTGGYFDCLGMERCRGTMVAVYAEGQGND